MSSNPSSEHNTNIISAGHCGVIRYEFDDYDNECFKAAQSKKSTLVSGSIASTDDAYFDDEPPFSALNSDSKTLSDTLVHDHATAISISVFREDQQNSNQQQHQPMPHVTSNVLHSTSNPTLKNDQQEQSEDTDDELDSSPLLKKPTDSGNS